jgi:ribosomal protein S18 acetylase RimI-like enzyme
VVVSIRIATIDDARTIAQIHVAAWRWAYRGLIADAALQALSAADRETMWADVIPRGGVAVAVAAGQIVGFVAFSTRGDEESRGGVGEVYAVYLLEGSTGMGIGRTLLEHATGELRAGGYEGAVLWVLADNAGATVLRDGGLAVGRRHRRVHHRRRVVHRGALRDRPLGHRVVRPVGQQPYNRVFQVLRLPLVHAAREQ